MRDPLKQFRRRLRSLRRSEAGTQLVEMAIALPIMLALFAATAEFGRYFYHYSTLAKSTRAGARYLTTTPVKADGANAAEDDKVKNLVVYGDPNAADGSTPVVSGLSKANVSIERAGGSTTVPLTVTVKIVDYNYKPVVNLGGFGDKLKWANVPVRPSTTMRFLLTQPTP